MWQPEGKNIDPSFLGSFEPTDILFEFEGEPLTFISHDTDGDLLLVHNLTLEIGVSRYLVAPIDPRIQLELNAGRLDLFSAMNQPRCWIADIVPDRSSEPPWKVKHAWKTAFTQLPAEFLPKPGSMACPGLDPFFRVRLIGPGVGLDLTTASDIKKAAQIAEDGLKGLARVAMDTSHGMKYSDPESMIHRLSDLPMKFTRVASFELAFGYPIGDRTSLDDTLLARMGELLLQGINLNRSTTEKSSILKSLDKIGTLELFKSIRTFCPAQGGEIDQIEIGGSLIELDSEPIMLCKSDYRTISNRIKAVQKSIEKPVIKIQGHLEVADSGAHSFTLRKFDRITAESQGITGDSIRFKFDDSLTESISRAWVSKEKVTVTANRIGRFLKAVEISI